MAHKFTIFVFSTAILLACSQSSFATFTTVINVPSDPVPSGGIGTDTQLNLFPGGTLSTVFSDFGMFGNAELNLRGGMVDGTFDANGTNTINVYEGAIQGTVYLTSFGPEMNIFGGYVDAIRSFGAVNISGGALGDSSRAGDDSSLMVSGGSIGSNFAVGVFAKADISGGTFGDGFSAEFRSEVHLTGKQFLLDGVNIAGSLTPQTPFTIVDRDVTLSGTLADGSQFSFDLNSTEMQGEDFFSTDAVLTVTLIPEPSSSLLLLPALSLLVATRHRSRWDG